MFVLDTLIVEKLIFVELHDIEDFLRLLELFALFQILNAVAALAMLFSSCDILLQYGHSLFALAH